MITATNKKNLIEFIENKINYELTKEDQSLYKKNNIEEWRKYSSILTLLKQYRNEQNFYSQARGILLKLYVLIDNKAKGAKK